MSVPQGSEWLDPVHHAGRCYGGWCQNNNDELNWAGYSAEGEVAVRKTKIRSLIIIGFFILLVGMSVAVARHIRVKRAAIQPPPGVLQPHVYPLPEDLLSALRNANGFQVHHTIANIPPLVRAAFAKATHQDFSMADPGDKWQSTDVIIETGLPWRRLTAVAASANFCLVFYELGGIGRSNNVAVFRLSSRAAEPVWHAYLDDSVADPASLAVAIDQKRIYVGATHF